MLFIIIFILQLLLLFLLSRFVTQAIASFFYQVTKKESWAVSALAILFFPGTLLHELAHFFMAIILMVRVGEIEFIPQIREGSVKLGSVQIGKTDPFRRALIGLAPLFVGVSCLLASIYFFSSFPLTPWLLNIVVVLILIFEISNTMFSSSRDVEGLPLLLIVLLLIGMSLYLSGIRLPASFWLYLSSEDVSNFMKMMCSFMLIPLVLDGLVLLTPKIFKR